MHKPVKNETVEHVFVKNPLTNRTLNLLPLFELMNRRNESSTQGPGEIVAILDLILRHITTNINEQVDVAGLELICIRIYEMKDAFSQMNEFKA